MLRYVGSEPEFRVDTPSALNDEIHSRLLKILAERPDPTQRQLAEALGTSFGKTNYCVKALLEKAGSK